APNLTTMPGSWRPTPRNHRHPPPIHPAINHPACHLALPPRFTLHTHCHHYPAPHSAAYPQQHPTDLRHLHPPPMSNSSEFSSLLTIIPESAEIPMKLVTETLNVLSYFQAIYREVSLFDQHLFIQMQRPLA